MKLITILLFLSLQANSQVKDKTWKYINPRESLKLLKTNVQRTGVVKRIYKEADGDYHLYLNMKDSNLICEIICIKEMPICKGYTNKIKIPTVGTKVRIKGDLVYDRKHKWFEIHPVKKIEEVK
jgi:hypothetical protein